MEFYIWLKNKRLFGRFSFLKIIEKAKAKIAINSEVFAMNWTVGHFLTEKSFEKCNTDDKNGLKNATSCLNYAKEIALSNKCYKMMLLTGSKRQSTLDFYKNAGYNSNDKTVFIQWLK